MSYSWTAIVLSVCHCEEGIALPKRAHKLRATFFLVSFSGDVFPIIKSFVPTVDEIVNLESTRIDNFEPARVIQYTSILSAQLSTTRPVLPTKLAAVSAHFTRSVANVAPIKTAGRRVPQITTARKIIHPKLGG